MPKIYSKRIKQKVRSLRSQGWSIGEISLKMNIPILNSKPDIRTKGIKTSREDYRGVCKIIYYDTSLQFELQSIGETIIKNGAGGT